LGRVLHIGKFTAKPPTVQEETVSHNGNTQITMTFTAEPNQVAEGDRLFTSHATWMKDSHHRDGELALLSYDVAKGLEVSNPLDGSSDPTGNTTFALTEVYENPAGLADHWKRGADEWQDFGAFVTWAGSVKLSVLHGSPVIHSLW
jgi:hypothetical protein